MPSHGLVAALCTAESALSDSSAFEIGLLSEIVCRRRPPAALAVARAGCGLVAGWEVCEEGGRGAGEGNSEELCSGIGVEGEGAPDDGEGG